MDNQLLSGVHDLVLAVKHICEGWNFQLVNVKHEYNNE